VSWAQDVFAVADSYRERPLSVWDALDRLRRRSHHPTNCGIYAQSIITVLRQRPHRVCTCDLILAAKVVAKSDLMDLLRAARVKMPIAAPEPTPGRVQSPEGAS
jgi:hypothetical protein